MQLKTILNRVQKAWERRPGSAGVPPAIKKNAGGTPAVPGPSSYYQTLSSLLNWFPARKMISSCVIEGFNNKLKLNTRKSYGFRTFRAAEVMLYHTLRDLPEPESTHRFC